MLPFVSDETLTKLEQNLSLMPAVSDLMAMGYPLEKVRDIILEGIGMDDSVQSELVPRFGPCEKDDLTVRAPALCVCTHVVLGCERNGSCHGGCSSGALRLRRP